MRFYGICLPPASKRDPNFELNRLTLEERINDHDTFDKPMCFKSKDQQAITINNHIMDYTKALTYYFIFRKGKWIYKDTSPFEIMNDYTEEDSGKIKSSLKRDKQAKI